MSFDKITFIPRHLDICMFDLVAGARESTPILSSVGCLNFPEAKLRLLSIILYLFHSFLFIHADFKGASLGQLSVTTRPVCPDDFVQISPKSSEKWTKILPTLKLLFYAYILHF